MNLQEMVDRLVSEGDRLTPGEAQTQTLARAVKAVQDACDIIDARRSWHFKYRTYEVPVTALTQPVLPSTYLNFGHSGGVSLVLSPGTPPKLQPLFPKTLWYYNRMRASGRVGRPETYTPGEGVDLSGDRYLFLEPMTNTDINLEVYCERAFPRLVLGVNDTAIKEIPERWHDGPIYETALRFLMKSKANIQSRTEQKEIAEQFLGDMSREERWGREAIQHIAPYGAR